MYFSMCSDDMCFVFAISSKCLRRQRRLAGMQVAPEYRRQGLANKLMNLLEEITIKRFDH